MPPAGRICLANPGHMPNPSSHNSIAVGPALKILQLNVEGLSAAKREIIGEIAHHHQADVICLQETHIPDTIAGRYNINGFDLISVSPDPVFGRATVRSDMADA